MNLRALSKFLSLILRHEATQFGVTLDRHGWAPINQILPLLQQKEPRFTREDLEYLVAESDKQRYEILGDRIRARYGHSLPVEPVAVPAVPPEILYHGTAGRNVPFILRDGLHAMKCRFVHLTPDCNLAARIGHRHSRNIVVLKIRARAAHDSGITFYDEHNFWLTEHIPPEFIEVGER